MGDRALRRSGPRTGKNGMGCPCAPFRHGTPRPWQGLGVKAGRFKAEHRTGFSSCCHPVMSAPYRGPLCFSPPFALQLPCQTRPPPASFWRDGQQPPACSCRRLQGFSSISAHWLRTCPPWRKKHREVVQSGLRLMGSRAPRGGLRRSPSAPSIVPCGGPCVECVWGLFSAGPPSTVESGIRAELGPEVGAR